MSEKKSKPYQFQHVSKCPHIKASHEQKNGKTIYHQGKTLQLCARCVAEIKGEQVQKVVYQITRFDLHCLDSEVIGISDKSLKELMELIDSVIEKYYPPGWLHHDEYEHWNSWNDSDNYASRQTALDGDGNHYRYVIEQYMINGFDLLDLSP